MLFFKQIYAANFVNYKNDERRLNHYYEIKVQFFSGPSITYKDDPFVKHIFVLRKRKKWHYMYKKVYFST
jgi:hypothetical protein